MDVDPATQPVSGGTFDIDFDQDMSSTPEFQLRQTSSFVSVRTNPSGGDDQGLSVIISGVSGANGSSYASALNSSVYVPAGQIWLGLADGSFAILGRSSTTYHWPDAGNRFLGLKFNLNGIGPYYGFARLKVEDDSSSFTIDKYCYNDTQGGSMHAEENPTAVTLTRLEASSGSPSPLRMLGAAAFAALAGLTAWWRRQLGRRGE